MTARRLHNMRSRTRAYLAHEYFTRHWTAMHFSEMADHLGVAKLSYACSARLLDDVAVLNLTPQQRALLAEIPDPELRESVQDFLTNKTFRRDYWVKGARRLSSFEQAKMLRAMSFVLCTARSQVPSSVEGVAGKASLQGAVYGPVLAALADQRPHLFEEIESAVAPAGVTLVQLVQAVTVLMGMGVVEVAQEQAAAREAKLRTDRLNMRLLRKARGDWDVHHLASPLTGGGVELDRIEQLFLLARAEGRPQALWPSFVLDLLLAQDHVIRREGRPLSPQEMRAEIERDCAVFCEERLPLLAALMVA